jgi:hypothetical protein
MKKQTTTFLMTLLCAAAASAGCSSSAPAKGDGGPMGTGVALVPDPNGFVAADTTGDTGIQGAWYAYGDGIGKNGMPPGDCQSAGHTEAGQCSVIETPVGMFTNTGGVMCTKGTVAKIIDMVGAAGPDYAKIWGAGIGLDLNNPGGAAVKGPIDATAKGLKGIQFDIDKKVIPGIRVEVESTETNGSEAGNDYWGATSAYPPSPVTMPGTYSVTWDKFVGPKGHVFNPATLLGIQFHVPASTGGPGPYEFCISNLKVLK